MDSDDAEGVVSELFEMIADLFVDSAVSTVIASSATTVSLVAAISF